MGNEHASVRTTGSAVKWNGVFTGRFARAAAGSTPPATAQRPARIARDRARLHRAAALGLTCYDLPEAYGGGGIERLDDACQVIEELTFGDSPIALVVGQGGFFAGPLLALGTEEQRRRWLPALCGPTPPP